MGYHRRPFKDLGRGIMEQCNKVIRLQTYLKSRTFLKDWIQVLAGSIFLSLISLATVPLHPTPMTLQTLGVFLLGLTLGRKKGVIAVVLYLVEATSGWPVLAGGKSNPLWMIGPNGGFLLGFIPAVFVIAYFSELFKRKTWMTSFISVMFGQTCIYIFGVSWLAYFLGFQKAIAVGVVPFLIIMPLKAILAATLYKPIEWVKKKKLS